MLRFSQRVRNNKNRRRLGLYLLLCILVSASLLYYIFYRDIWMMYYRWKYNRLMQSMEFRSRLFPPKTLHEQHPEHSRVHLPPMLYSSAIRPAITKISNGTCDYSKFDGYSIDSNGNVCKFEDIDQNVGCCRQNAIISDSDQLFSCKACAKGGTTESVPYTLFKGHACECCDAFSGCISKCLRKFVAKPFDASLQEEYRWESCKTVCATSSKSNKHSKYYIDPGHKYCYGNQYYSSSQYAIMATLAPSQKIVLADTNVNCKQTCSALNEDSKCLPSVTEIFEGDNCENHELLTESKCAECVEAPPGDGPSIQYKKKENQICYKSSHEPKDFCEATPTNREQQQICLCSLLSLL